MRKSIVRTIASLSGAALMLSGSLSFGATNVDLQKQADAHLKAARQAAAAGKAWMYGPLIMCYPQDNRETQAILKSPPATRVFDNLYFLGMGTVAAWAVTTSDGIVLIDTLDNPGEAQQYILDGMAKLGLEPDKVKYIIVTHGHADHYGGGKFLQGKLPGAHLLMSAADYDFAEKAAAGPRGRGIPAPTRDMVATDGQRLTVGDTTIQLYLTPGHTPGTISMILPVKDHGKTHLISMWGGSASANASPEMHAAYDRSIKRFQDIVRAQGVEGIFANHPPLDDAAGKIEHMAETPDAPNPYLIGNDEVLRNYKIFEECNLYHTALSEQKKTGM